MQLKSDDVIVLWMIRLAVMALSRFKVGSDGETAYERRKQRKCTIEVVPFGEKVWYKQIREGKDRKDKFEGRSVAGTLQDQQRGPDRNTGRSCKGVLNHKAAGK